MVEIVFSDSAGGSIKLAQQYGWDDVFNEVFSLHLAWSVGSIAESNVGNERLAVLLRLFSTYPEIGQEAAEELHHNTIKSLTAIRCRAENGETLRVWYSNGPDEMCGFHWLMDLLKDWKLPSVKVVMVMLPEWEIKDETLIQYNSWGEIEPENWQRCLDLQKTAPPVLLEATASRWAELRQENAMLRAVVNGRLQSVPESFYDHFILREIASESAEFHEARLIGRILGKYQLGISDSWLALRIEEMICVGKLQAVTAAPANGPSYHRTLKKAF